MKDINDKRVTDHRRGRHKFKNGKDDDRSKHNVEKPCYKCGAQPSHPPNRCPAKNVTCSVCKKKGHFAKVCKSSKRVQSVDDCSSEDEVSVMTIGETVNMVENNLKWKTNVLIRNHNVKFKIDAYADFHVSLGYSDHSSAPFCRLLFFFDNSKFLHPRDFDFNFVLHRKK